MDLLTPSSSGVFRPCLWPLKAPWRENVAETLISPLSSAAQKWDVILASGPSSNDDYLGHSKNHDWLIGWLIDWLIDWLMLSDESVGLTTYMRTSTEMAFTQEAVLITAHGNTPYTFTQEAVLITAHGNTPYTFTQEAVLITAHGNTPYTFTQEAVLITAHGNTPFTCCCQTVIIETKSPSWYFTYAGGR